MGFTNWKAAALAVAPLVLVLLTQALMRLFSQGPQAKYDHLLGVAQEVGREQDYYQGYAVNNYLARPKMVNLTDRQWLLQKVIGYGLVSC